MKYDMKDAVFQSQRATSADLQSLLSSTTNQFRKNPSADSSADSELPPSSLPGFAPLPSSPSDRLTRKRRKIERSQSAARRDVYPSPRASASESQLRLNAVTPKPRATPKPSGSAARRKQANSSDNTLHPASGLERTLTTLTLLGSNPASPDPPTVEDSHSPSRTTLNPYSAPIPKLPRSPASSVPLSAAPSTLARATSGTNDSGLVQPASLSSPPSQEIPDATPQIPTPLTPLPNSNINLTVLSSSAVPSRTMPSKPFSLKDVRAQLVSQISYPRIACHRNVGSAREMGPRGSYRLMTMTTTTTMTIWE